MLKRHWKLITAASISAGCLVIAAAAEAYENAIHEPA